MKRITGTRIAKILGVSPWGGPMDAFMECMEMAEPVAENEAMEWGKRLEPIVAQAYTDKTGYKLTQGTYMESSRWPFMGGTPDFIVDDDLILEVKTTGLRNAADWGEAGTDKLPDYYLTQVAWYMALCNVNKAHVAVLIGGQEFRIYSVMRDVAVESVLLEAAERFWNHHLLTGNPPPIDGTPAYTNYLRTKFKSGTEALLESDDEFTRLAAELHDAESRIQEAEARKTLAIQQLMSKIGLSKGVRGEFGKIQWVRPKGSTRIDWQGVASALNPPDDVIKAHTTTQDRKPYLLASWAKSKSEVA